MTQNDPSDPHLELPLHDGPPIGEVGCGTTPVACAVEPETLTLALADLLPDASGEVVISDRTGLDIAVLTNEMVAAHGIAETRVTESGFEVGGLAYCTFEGGVTLFYAASQKLLVIPDGEL